MVDWKEKLLSLNEILEDFKRREPLWHGGHFVYVSDVAKQFYCERKVELTYKLGKIETEEMNEGIIIHDEIMKMNKVTLQQLIEDISSKICCARFPLVAEVEGLPLAGIPDLIGFEKGEPKFVLELKTFKPNKTFRLHRDHSVQVKLYGLLLEETGFNCSKLALYVAGVRRKGNIELLRKALSRFAFVLVHVIRAEATKVTYISKEHINSLIKHEKLIKAFRLNEHLMSITDAVASSELSIYYFPYNREDALNDLRWARGFWLKEREAIPTQRSTKCRACEYLRRCWGSS